MPVSITVRDVPDDVRDELAMRAARSGRSLQEYLKNQLVDLARKPDIDSWLTLVRHRKAATGSTLSVDEIVESLDADRR